MGEGRNEERKDGKIKRRRCKKEESKAARMQGGCKMK